MTRYPLSLALALLAGLAIGAEPGAEPGAESGAEPAAASSSIAPFSSGTIGQAPAAPWQIVTLPKLPQHTRYTIAATDAGRALHAEARASYANLVHPLRADAALTPTLAWRWKVDRVPARADLAAKATDDLAAKLCVFFDLPPDRMSAGDRIKIRLGRALYDPELPTATLCYVWDRLLPVGTVLPNVYTDRVRFIVLRSAAAGQIGQWFDEKRDLRADFARVFGREAEGGTPPITAVALASDADNTGDSASAWFGDIRLERP
ncbi:MAG: DUF3047 domain-containing protein [Burkholderiaceae bacterium]